MGEIISQDVSGRLKRSLGHYTDLNSLTTQMSEKVNYPDTVFFGPLAKAKNASSVRSNWWLCGDSKEESYGASSFSNRAISQVKDKFRTLYPSGVAGGEFKKARNNLIGALITTFTFSGSNNDVALGFGQLGKQLSYNATTPGTATLTNVTCTEFELYLYRLSADQVTIKVDGVLLATYTLPVTGSKGSLFESGVLAKNAGTDVHTIEIQQTGGSNSAPVLAGINLINGDKTKGLHFYDHTSSGSKVSMFVGQDSDSASTKTSKESWAEFLPLAVPSLVVMEWLTNDCVTDNATLYENNVRKFITLVRTKSGVTVPFLLMPPEEPSDRVLINPWKFYLDALDRISKDTPLVRFYDVSKRIPKQGNGNPNGIYMDAVHYAPFFQETWAQMHVDAITGQWSR
jgi:hypothetical protein